MAEQLATKVNANQILYDDGTLGCNINHRHAWQQHAAHPTNDWAVVLEDDAQPVDEFRDQLTAALEVAPTPIVSLYLGTGRPLGGWQPKIRQTILTAGTVNACWISSTHLLHAVAVAIRTPLLPSLLDWLPIIPKPIDEATSIWAMTHGHMVGYTWPSLVNHADQESLAQHPDGKPRDRVRVAWRTGTRRQWTGRQVTMTSPYDRSR